MATKNDKLPILLRWAKIHAPDAVVIRVDHDFRYMTDVYHFTFDWRDYEGVRHRHHVGIKEWELSEWIGDSIMPTEQALCHVLREIPLIRSLVKEYQGIDGWYPSDAPKIEPFVYIPKRRIRIHRYNQRRLEN